MNGLLIPKYGTVSTIRYGARIPQPELYGQVTVQAGDSVTGASEQTFATTYNIRPRSLVAGQVLAVDATGIYNQFSTPGSQTVKVKFGSTTICASGTFAGTASMSNRGWKLHALITVISIGSSGTVEAQGWLSMATAVKNSIEIEMPNTAVVGSIDTTGTLNLNLSWTQTNSNAANNAQMRQLIVTLLNP